MGSNAGDLVEMEEFNGEAQTAQPALDYEVNGAI